MRKSIDISKHLAAFIADTTYEDLPKKTVEMTKRSILDAIGVTLAASGLYAPCRAFAEMAVESAPGNEATILGFQLKAKAEHAAFANGAMAHAMDFEDAHDKALLHPNAAAFPAALAIAEARGRVSGKSFITAMAVGCDLVCRMGLAMEEITTRDGWYLPPIVGAFGAAAAVGKLLALSPAQIVDAFSLTLCQATCSAELQDSPHSDVRAVRDAFAARSGLVAALLAEKGVRGFDFPFEGKAGFFNLYVGGRYDPSVLINGLGQSFEGENISFKPWPACRGTHPFIEAALKIRLENCIQSEDIASVRTVSSPFSRMLTEPASAKRRPKTAIDAKFSIPFGVATALAYGDVKLLHFFPERLTEPTVLQLVDRIHCNIDESLSQKDAAKGLVEITLKDGTKVSQGIDVPLGNPANPIPSKALVDKFFDCAGLAAQKLPESRIRQIADGFLNLEKVDDIRLLAQAFAPGT